MPAQQGDMCQAMVDPADCMPNLGTSCCITPEDEYTNWLARGRLSECNLGAGPPASKSIHMHGPPKRPDHAQAVFLLIARLAGFSQERQGVFDEVPSAAVQSRQPSMKMPMNSAPQGIILAFNGTSKRSRKSRCQQSTQSSSTGRLGGRQAVQIALSAGAASKQSRRMRDGTPVQLPIALALQPVRPSHAGGPGAACDRCFTRNEQS